MSFAYVTLSVAAASLSAAAASLSASFSAAFAGGLAGALAAGLSAFSSAAPAEPEMPMNPTPASSTTAAGLTHVLSEPSRLRMRDISILSRWEVVMLLCRWRQPEDDVELRRQLADPGILDRRKIHEHRLARPLVADAAEHAV